MGTGSFGRVYIATHLRTNRTYAIKALSKTHLVRNQQVCVCVIKTPTMTMLLSLCSYLVFVSEIVCRATSNPLLQVAHAKAECEVLKQISHPFVINLRGHFQDEAHIYLVMDFVAGGEFFTHLKSKGR